MTLHCCLTPLLVGALCCMRQRGQTFLYRPPRLRSSTSPSPLTALFLHFGMNCKRERCFLASWRSAASTGSRDCQAVARIRSRPYIAGCHKARTVHSMYQFCFVRCALKGCLVTPFRDAFAPISGSCPRPLMSSHLVHEPCYLAALSPLCLGDLAPLTSDKGSMSPA
jgi:hypothetical protein